MNITIFASKRIGIKALSYITKNYDYDVAYISENIINYIKNEK